MLFVKDLSPTPQSVESGHSMGRQICIPVDAIQWYVRREAWRGYARNLVESPANRVPSLCGVAVHAIVIRRPATRPGGGGAGRLGSRRFRKAGPTGTEAPIGCRPAVDLGTQLRSKAD